MDEDATVELDGPSMSNIDYTWTVDGEDILIDSDGSYTFASFIPGTYEVCLLAYYSDLCKSDTCRLIEVKESLQLFIPNSFSPGGDGLNDGFYPVVSNQDLLKSYELQIFNRWGDILFSSTDPMQAWDGRYLADGEYFVPDGVYSYILHYQTQYDVELRVVKGNITIVR